MAGQAVAPIKEVAGHAGPAAIFSVTTAPMPAADPRGLEERSGFDCQVDSRRWKKVR